MQLGALQAPLTKTITPVAHQARSRRRACRCHSPDAEAASASQAHMQPHSLQFGQPDLAQQAANSNQQAKADINSMQHRKLPDVDWSRYHLQVLFIDRSDQLRARLAAGLFEKVAEWNGFGRVLLAWTAGLSITPPHSRSTITTTAALMTQAVMLGIPPKMFARSPEAFELRDLDSYDIVVALDTETREEVLRRVEPQYLNYYSDKVHLLSDYAQHQPLSDAEVLRKGGLALLPRSMSNQLTEDLERLRQEQDVIRPSLSDASPQGVRNWNWCVLVVMLGCAGLVRYLIDAYPSDLPEYDPL